MSGFEAYADYDGLGLAELVRKGEVEPAELVEEAIRRIEQKSYAKILVRHLYSPDFWYDYWSWRQSSGIRQALQENYHEARRIPAVTQDDRDQPRYMFSEVSVLVPNPR